MSGELAPLGSGGVLSRDGRRVGRAIGRGRLHGELRIAAADVDTDIAIAKVEDLTMATGTAMQAVVRVAQAQKQLEQLAPDASGRLAFIADAHALAMNDALADLRRELRRR